MDQNEVGVNQRIELRLSELEGKVGERWVDELVIRQFESRIAKLEAWARKYAGPILYRTLSMGEKLEINQGVFDPPAGRDVPDLKAREL